MSSKNKSQSLHVLLPLGQMSDKERADTGTTIGTMAPSSPIYTQSTHVQAAVADVVSLTAALKSADASVTHDEAQLALSRGGRDTVRTKLDRSLGVYTSLAENLATTVDEAAALGLTARIGRAAPAPLAPPDGVIVKLGTKHGQFRVSAKTSLRTGHYGAQISADPVGPLTWQDLTGGGKSRLITGHASGSLVWVRFRLLRGQQASDWCTPVPVTVP
jgi:hypothetical protein